MAEDRFRPLRKAMGHAVIGGVGAGVRAGIDADRNLDQFQKLVAKSIVTILQGAGHALVEYSL